MPNYSYRCPKCRHERSVVRSMQDSAAITLCDRCETVPMEKLLMGGITFAYGRQNFHDGPEGDGRTLREVERDWINQARSAGIEPERV